ncbi:MAG TPA: carboxymuconolactone decarboxylase family protein [Pseudomonadales bacterium]|nr:carboxymuconolactone decarboxylase family protein [Pseudomonadales bacterium]
MSSRDERRAKGREAFNAVYGGMMTAPEERTGDDFFEFMLEDLFGNIWSREGLSLRDRRLVTMGAIAALGEGDVFGIQVETGLASGHLTEEQVNEMILHLTQYIGYPRVTGMRGAAGKAIHNWKKKQKEKDAQK